MIQRHVGLYKTVIVSGDNFYSHLLREPRVYIKFYKSI